MGSFGAGVWAASGLEANVSTQHPHTPPILALPASGDGEQTRSFMFVDDCVEGTLRIMNSDCTVPLNLGTEEMVSMNEFAAIAMSFEGKSLPIKHIPGPMGVRGRNSDNTMIREKLGWAPSIAIRAGLERTYFWIKGKADAEAAAGVDISAYGHSKVSGAHPGTGSAAAASKRVRVASAPGFCWGRAIDAALTPLRVPLW